MLRMQDVASPIQKFWGPICDPNEGTQLKWHLSTPDYLVYVFKNGYHVIVFSFAQSSPTSEPVFVNPLEIL